MKPLDIFCDTSGLLPFLVPALPGHEDVSLIVRQHLRFTFCEQHENRFGFLNINPNTKSAAFN